MLGIVAALLTLIAGLSLFRYDVAATELVFIDDFNIYLVALTTFVAFTTSLFSAFHCSGESDSAATSSRRITSCSSICRGESSSFRPGSLRICSAS